MEDLKKREQELRKTLADLRFQNALGKLLDTSAIEKTKRELARLLTKATAN